MYLVLTAMLALNVSADIINGFSKLRHSMETSMGATYSRTSEVMANFEMEYNKDEASQAKYGPWYEIAKDVYKSSEEMYNYLENFKLDIANMVDAPKEPYTQMPEGLKAGDDTNKPHAYALLQTDPTTGRINAEELKIRLGGYANYMATPLSDCFKERMERPAFKKEWEAKADMINTLFQTEDVYDEAEKKYITWEESTFHEMPAAAVTALIAKYQNDVRTVEYDVINFLFSQTSASTFIANTVEALVIPQNGEYIMQGQQYRAKIVSAMMDTNQAPRVFIGNQELVNGVYTVGATSPGEHTYTGYMLVGDDTTHYNFKGKYTVGAPSATISNTELNILYRGYDNPFSISVPGTSSDKVKVVCNGATITKKDGLWIIKPGESLKDFANIEVYAEVDGKQVSMGTQKYRVKTLPKPDAYLSFNGTVSESDKVRRSQLLDPNTRVVASYGADGLIQAKFTITGFTVVMPSGTSFKINGDKFDQKSLAAIGKLTSGQMVTIKYIKAKGPDGKEVTLRALLVEMN